jgi:RimJ/RimL family protein N-acetyltransferase
MKIKSIVFDKLEICGLTSLELDLIRIWKNNNSQYFFKKNIISSNDQIKWFKKYSDTENDFMFIIKFENKKIGTIGIREYEGNWDIYNVILGEKEFGGKGFISEALNLIIEFAINKYNYDITARVLKSNKNIKWYIENNFQIIDEKNEYYLIKKI